MKLQQTSHHTQSFVIAGIAILVIIILALNLWQYFVPQTDSIDWLSPTGQTLPLSSDQAATEGQLFVKSLASYDQTQNQPVLSQETELLEPGLWIARYEVKQLYKDDWQVYLYTVEVRDGRVTNYSVAVSDQARQVFIFTPFPSEIIASDTLSIKGQLSAELGSQFNQVKVQLINFDTSALIQTYQLTVDEANNYTYLKEILKPSSGGEVILRISAGESFVEIPFISASDESRNL